MALDLKANTAVDVLIGPFVDSTDGNTDETGLTISQSDVRLSKNGQNMAQKNDANACTHDELGFYNCPLDATDTNTEGQLVLVVHESGALPVRHEFNIMAEAAWDSLYAAKDTGYMDVNVKAVSEDTTAADNLESACDNYSVTRGLAGTALPNAAADAAGGLPISDAGELDLDAQIGTDIDAILTDTGTTIEGHLTDIEADTQDLQTQIGTDGAGLTNMPWNASWDAQVESEVNDALVALDLDHLVHVADDDDVADNSIIAKMSASDGDWSGFAAADDSLEAISDGGGGGPTAGEIADAVWDEAAAGHTDAGKAGEQLWTDVDAILTDTGTTLNDKIDTIDGIVDDILEDTGTTLDGIVDAILVDTGTTIPGLIAALENLSAAEVNAEVVDALSTDTHSELGSLPGASPTIIQMLMLLYMALRNKIDVTSSAKEVHKDGGTVLGTKTLSDNGTTYSESKMA